MLGFSTRGDTTRGVSTSRSFPLDVTVTAGTCAADNGTERRRREHIQMDPDLFRQLKAAGLIDLNQHLVLTMGGYSCPLTVVINEAQSAILTVRIGVEALARFPDVSLPASGTLTAYAPSVTDDATAQAQGLYYEFEDDDDVNDVCLVIAPHGGGIELHTHTWAAELKTALDLAGVDASVWGGRGYGPGDQDSYDAHHISTVDLNIAQHQVLDGLDARGWTYCIAVHGQSGSARIDLGCDSSENAFVDGLVTDLQAHPDLSGVTIARSTGTGEIDGSDSHNLVNRLSAHGVQIEATLDVRADPDMRAAVCEVFAAAYGAL
jgi:phage replication-related protein YjqB (UPF0714/DUF867 family)